MNVITDYCTEFKTADGIKRYFVKYVGTKYLLSWTKNDNNGYDCQGISVGNVGVKNLKALKVWDSLPEKIQQEVINYEDTKKNESQDKMTHARGKRRNKYPNVPRELTCVKCKALIKTVPSILAKKLEKLNLTSDKYAETYECTKCHPVKRGRKKNPANTPTDMVCKCGKTMTYPLNHIKRIADKKGVPVEDFIKGYVCQTCVPTKGRKKK